MRMVLAQEQSGAFHQGLSTLNRFLLLEGDDSGAVSKLSAVSKLQVACSS